jgi:hypothetical protein
MLTLEMMLVPIMSLTPARETSRGVESAKILTHVNVPLESNTRMNFVD